MNIKDANYGAVLVNPRYEGEFVKIRGVVRDGYAIRVRPYDRDELRGFPICDDDGWRVVWNPAY